MYVKKRRVLAVFSVGDYIIYGNSGVCKVMNVGPLEGGDGREYYTLKPVYIRDSSILTPVDNERVVMRDIMTKEEAEEFISNIKDIGTLDVEDERKIDHDYKKALLSCNPTEIVKTIKTIYFRTEERQTEGKKATASDSKYFHIAEDNLYGELAISLDMNKDEVRDYIKHKA